LYKEAMVQASARYRWLAAGDASAFFALVLDNLTNIVLLVSILVGGFHFHVDVFVTRMVPGTALGVCAGDLAYTWLAFRLARRSGRADVTAMPLGLDTPSTVGIAVAVLGPTWAMSHDAILTWQVGMAAVMLMGVVKVAAAFAGDAVRRVIPSAGLLGSIGGVGLVLLGFLPLMHVFAVPVAGLAALGLVLFALVARLPLPLRAPGALAAVLVGTVLYYALGLAGLVHDFHLPPPALTLSFPLPTIGFVHGLTRAFGYLPLAVPFGLLTIVGGINVTESARAAGDDYRTRDVLLVEALATLAAGLTGGVAQSTPYIGHPAYKAMGARAGYTLFAGVAVGLGGTLGVVQLLAQAVPATAVAPILLFVGIEIVGQAYRATPRAHAAAVTIAFLPSVAELRRIATGTVLARLPLPLPPGDAASYAHELDVLARGFIITGMLWGALVADLIDRRPARAALWCLVCSVLSHFGLIHSVLPNGPLYLPWRLVSTEPWHIAAAYLVMGLLFVVIPTRPESAETTPLANAAAPERSRRAQPVA
jgi:AGZA family xanthine/uracil permease-like MFS transporter